MCSTKTSEDRRQELWRSDQGNVSIFINHALVEHPRARDAIPSIEVNDDILPIEDDIKDEPKPNDEDDKAKDPEEFIQLWQEECNLNQPRPPSMFIEWTAIKSKESPKNHIKKSKKKTGCNHTLATTPLLLSRTSGERG